MLTEDRMSQNAELHRDIIFKSLLGHQQTQMMPGHCTLTCRGGGPDGTHDIVTVGMTGNLHEKNCKVTIRCEIHQTS